MKVNEKIVGGVVAFNDKMEVWKSIPGFSNYQINNFGSVREGFKEIKPFKSKTSVGFYYVVVLKNDKGMLKFRGVHQLVCLTFNGEKPNNVENWVVNHKNGIKQDNRPSNLEWVTHSNNCFHAIENGLRKDNKVVRVHDINKDDVIVFISISEAARFFNIPRFELKKIMARKTSKEFLYRNQYYFYPNELLNKGISKVTDREVIAYDFINDEEFIAKSFFEMQILTKVEATTIALQLKRRAEAKPDKMVNGYVFREVNDFDDITIFTKKEALMSRYRYFSKRATERNKPIEILDHLTGDISVASNLREAAKKTNVLYQTLVGFLAKPNIGLTKGYSFKRLSDKRPFPIFKKEKIVFSINQR